MYLALWLCTYSAVKCPGVFSVLLERESRGAQWDRTQQHSATFSNQQHISFNTITKKCSCICLDCSSDFFVIILPHNDSRFERFFLILINIMHYDSNSNHQFLEPEISGCNEALRRRKIFRLSNHHTSFDSINIEAIWVLFKIVGLLNFLFCHVQSASYQANTSSR